MPDLGDFLDDLGLSKDIDDRLEFLSLVVPVYIDEGYSGARAIADLRSQGFSINSNLYYLYQRQYFETQNEFETIRYFPSSYYPNDTDLGKSDVPMGADYKFIFRVKHQDELTGENYFTTFGVETNSFGSIADIEQMGLDYINEFYPRFEEEGVELEVWKGMRKL